MFLPSLSLFCISLWKSPSPFNFLFTSHNCMVWSQWIFIEKVIYENLLFSILVCYLNCIKRDLGNEHRKTNGSFSYLISRVIIILVCPEKPFYASFPRIFINNAYWIFRISRFMWQVIMANHLYVEQIGANMYSSATTWPTLYLRATKIQMTENRTEKSANFLIHKMCNINVAILKSD